VHLGRLDPREGIPRPADAEYARSHPHYGWERNKGYGTPDHLAALRRLDRFPAAPPQLRARGAGRSCSRRTPWP
jgi:hypothetical protein